ncbi:MAG: MFS transporter [Endozoicomonas sp.]|uniref:MFS transporter n=1 Tax=Endozoicomonas sp. TaxID=1892382 RepID=UPI003D9B405F
MNNHYKFFAFSSFREVAVNFTKIIFAWWVITISSISELSRLMTISLTILILLTPILAPLSSRFLLNRALSVACFIVAVGYAGYGISAYLYQEVNSPFLLASIVLAASGMAIVLPLSNAVLASLENIDASSAVRTSRSISSGLSIVAPIAAGVLLTISIDIGMALACFFMLIASIFALSLKIKGGAPSPKRNIKFSSIYKEWGRQQKNSFRIKWEIATERGYLIIACAVQFILAGMLSIVIPFEIKDTYKATGFELGLSEALVAGGMFLSATWLLPKINKWISKYYISSLGLMIGSLGLLVCSISNVIYIFYIGLFLFGLGFSIYGMNGVAHRLKAFPKNLRVSLSAFDITASRLAMLFGLIIAPILIDFFGSNMVVGFYSTVSILLSFLLLRVTGWKDLMESTNEELDEYYGKLIPNIK